MGKRTNIKELQANQVFDGVYSIQNAQLGQTRNGKPFLKCLLGDRTGRKPGRMWNMNEEHFATLPTDGFVWIEGQAQPYQGELQIIIQAVQPITPSEQDLKELLPSSPHDPDVMLEQLIKLLDSVKSKPLRYLIEAYVSDEPLMDKFAAAPAATNLHHAYIGGLLEHTLALVRLGDAFCGFYPGLNRDLVLVGLFIHDLGKISELRWSEGFSYTTEGQLVGHIVQGVLWLERKIAQARERGGEISEELALVLKHIILSHHGQLEFGAVKIPATPEAIAVSLLDNLDARLHMALTACRDPDLETRDLGGDFTEKLWALETRLYRPDPLRPAAPPTPTKADAGKTTDTNWQRQP
ncbi:MAG: HD domain-containing protein [Phycisphaeraceae bacterium]|nr:HD domain-containing protein [Phycisphaeraceae bacterium]